MGIFLSKNEINDEYSRIINQQLTRNLAIAYINASIIRILRDAIQDAKIRLRLLEYINTEPDPKTELIYSKIRSSLLEGINTETNPKIKELTNEIINQQITKFKDKINDIKKTPFVCNKYLKLKDLELI